MGVKLLFGNSSLTLRGLFKSLVGLPPTVNDIEAVRLDSLEAMRSGNDAWTVVKLDPSVSASVCVLSGMSSAIQSFTEIAGNLPLSQALDLMARLDPPGMRKDTGRLNHPASVASMIGHKFSS